MLAYMVIREAAAGDWSAIWPILKEVGAAGETLTWDPART
jgi:predicted RNase H-like HicB family nuclease